MYSTASGAVLSLPKSFGIRIGRQRHSRGDLPAGWVIGRDIQITDDPVRYLGIFLGQPEAVRAIWEARVTAKMRTRYARWRERAPPRTRVGRNIVIRNSVLACGWHMAEAQCLPWLGGRAGVLESWRRDAWRFFEGGEGDKPGRPAVSRAVLIQDYHEGGMRCMDVETVVDSMYVKRVLALAHPAPNPDRGLVLYWLNGTYGHLRMGCRLLVSTCDFLILHADIPDYWRVALQAYGSRRGLVPSAKQEHTSPEVTYSEARRGAVRTVAVPAGESFATVLMAPLWYNPCLSGWLGASVLEPEGFELEHRARHPEVRLYRGTPPRLAAAREYYDVTVACASVGITHVIDLLDGLSPGERLCLRELDPQWPAVVRSTYMELLRALPREWLLLIRRAAALRAGAPALSLSAIVARLLPAEGAWVCGPGNLVTRVANGAQVEGWYLPTPMGRLRRAEGVAQAAAFPAWLARAREAVVWREESLPSCEEEALARERQRARSGGEGEEPSYVIAGLVEDRRRLYEGGAGASLAATDLSRFAWQYGVTDRESRLPVGLHVARVHELYDLRVSRLFTPPRTFRFEAGVRCGLAVEHTTWLDLLLPRLTLSLTTRGEDSPIVIRPDEAASMAQGRGLLFGSRHMTGHDRVAKDLGYSVLLDALPLGNDRCSKRGLPSYMLCDVCLAVHGMRCRETARHAFWDCPHVSLLMDLIERARLEATTVDVGVLRAARMRPSVELLREAACPLLTGCVLPDQGVTPPRISLACSIQAEVHARRASNVGLARLGYGVRFGVADMYRAVCARLVREGAALQRKAVEWEAELSVRYPGWVPAEGEGPVAEWEAAWLQPGYVSFRPSGGLRCCFPPASDVPGTLYHVAGGGWVCAPLRVAGGAAGTFVRVPLSIGVRAPLLGAGVRVRLSVGPAGRVALAAAACDPSERQRRAAYAKWAAEASAHPTPTDWVVYTDGGYERGGNDAALTAECAGWGWVAVSGGDGEADSEAVELARACGPVDLDEHAPEFLGARRLSNNVAEGQGLGEALRWLLAAEPPDRVAIWFRTDNQLVAGWALGTTRVRANAELAASVRSLWLQAAARWRLAWSHVRGHSGHRWNTLADELATRGCRGESEGFLAGVPPPEAPEPVPPVADRDRYVWLVRRTVTAVREAGTGDVVLLSEWPDRARLRVLRVPAGGWLPLSDPPSESVLTSLVRGVQVARSRPGERLVCHERPQSVVIDAGGMGSEAARDWAEWMVDLGIGQCVETLRVPPGVEDSALWRTCRPAALYVEAADVEDATGWRPPAERDGCSDEEAAGWGDDLELGVDALGQAGVAAPASPPLVDDEPLGVTDVGAGVGVWRLSHAGVVYLGADGELRPLPRPPTPPTVRRGPRLGPAIFWPRRRSGVGALGQAGFAAPASPPLVDDEPLGVTDVGAGVGVWHLSHAGVVYLGANGELRPLPRPPTPPTVRRGPRLGPAIFWPRRRSPAVMPPASPLGLLGLHAPAAIGGVEPDRAGVFAGWASGGRELSRLVWRVPAGVCRPVPVRPTASFVSQVDSDCVPPAPESVAWSPLGVGAEPVSTTTRDDDASPRVPLLSGIGAEPVSTTTRGGDATPRVSFLSAARSLISSAWSLFSSALGSARTPCASGLHLPGRSPPPHSRITRS